MAVDFEFPDIAVDAANPPVVPIFADLDTPDGVSIADARVTVTATGGDAVDSLWGAVLRRSSVPPRLHPRYARKGRLEPGNTFKFGKLSNAVPGHDNKLVVWAALAAGGNDVVAQVPFVGQFDAELTLSQRAARLAQANQGLMQALASFGGTNAPVINVFWLGALGNVTIKQPDQGNPIPVNWPVTAIPGMQFYAIRDVAGELTGGTPVNVWAVVLRAAAPIPPLPFGFPNPVEATITFGKYFYFSSVPGAVLGSDNKLVVWAQFMLEPAPVIATRAFCGV